MPPASLIDRKKKTMSAPQPNRDYDIWPLASEDWRRASRPQVDIARFETDRLAEIAKRIRELPYGEYMELCDGVGINPPDLWNWSRKKL
jgi:hypothetical protein